MEGKLRNLIRSMIDEILHDLDEANTTSSVGGEYMTPFAFTRTKKYKTTKNLMKGKSLEGSKIVSDKEQKVRKNKNSKF